MKDGRKQGVVFEREKGRAGTCCIVYLPPSIVACGSELRSSRRIIILALDLGSESSVSDCFECELL